MRDRATEGLPLLRIAPRELGRMSQHAEQQRCGIEPRTSQRASRTVRTREAGLDGRRVETQGARPRSPQPGAQNGLRSDALHDDVGAVPIEPDDAGGGLRRHPGHLSRHAPRLEDEITVTGDQHRAAAWVREHSVADAGQRVGTAALGQCVRRGPQPVERQCGARIDRTQGLVHERACHRTEPRAARGIVVLQSPQTDLVEGLLRRGRHRPLSLGVANSVGQLIPREALGRLDQQIEFVSEIEVEHGPILPAPPRLRSEFVLRLRALHNARRTERSPRAASRRGRGTNRRVSRGGWR